MGGQPETILLVDYENIKDTGLGRLPPHSRIKLFVGKGQKPKIKFIEETLSRNARLDLLPVAEQGRNNLDFYIAFYLGKGVADEPDASFVIVSNDRDLDPLITHLQARGISCRRDGTQAAAASVAAPPKPPKSAAPQAEAKPAKAHTPKQTAGSAKRAPSKTDSNIRPVVDALKGLGKQRPTTKGKLANYLGQRFKKTWPDVGALIAALEQEKAIKLNPKGGVEYLP